MEFLVKLVERFWKLKKNSGTLFEVKNVMVGEKLLNFEETKKREMKWK